MKQYVLTIIMVFSLSLAASITGTELWQVLARAFCIGAFIIALDDYVDKKTAEDLINFMKDLADAVSEQDREDRERE